MPVSAGGGGCVYSRSSLCCVFMQLTLSVGWWRHRVGRQHPRSAGGGFSLTRRSTLGYYHPPPIPVSSHRSTCAYVWVILYWPRDKFSAPAHAGTLSSVDSKCPYQGEKLPPTVTSSSFCLLPVRVCCLTFSFTDLI